ncbi:MAG: cytidylate kinase-like family protein, partial [bacterium]
MSVICISRGSYGYGKELAEKLASKMDAACLNREVITDEATDFGIPVGKLEMAVLKHRPISEAMGIVRDMFKAYVAAYLSERALEGNIVYHGRSGHLVLPDLKSVLRVRTIDDTEARIERVVERLRLSREKAKTYAAQVDEDRKRWVRRIYNVDWDDPSLYDVTLNAAHLSSENSAGVLVEMAQLSEFQITPASTRILQDTLLSSRCRLAIGKAENTRNLSVAVQANKGYVSVTYPPHQSRQAEHIPAVLERVDGIKSLVCTLATTNILYIGDHFDPSSPDFNHLVEIAEKWNAAVDLAQLKESAAEEPEMDEDLSVSEPIETGIYDGGILPETEEEDDIETAGRGAPETMDYLIQVGRAGRFRSFKGGSSAMLTRFSPAADYSLIVVGDVFSDRQKIRQ